MHEGGSTNLSGGWLKGRTRMEEGLVEGVNRVVLLPDGMAKAGIIEPPAIRALMKKVLGAG